ncbi:unnamed protein product, partial [Meganyctiphanes norvegica]
RSMYPIMKVPVVSTFFGLNLKTSSYIISVLSVMASIVDIALRIKIIYDFDKTKQGDDKEKEEQLRIVNLVLLLLFVVQLIIAFLLIYGIRTGKKSIVMLWVGSQVIFLPLCVLDLMMIGDLFMHLKIPGPLIFCGVFAFVVFGLYCLIAVRSYAKQRSDYEIAETTPR